MAQATVERFDGKIVLALSEEAQQELELVEGATLDLQRTDQGLKIRRHHYTLEELLAQCDYSLPMDEEEREWLDAPPVGRELI